MKQILAIAGLAVKSAVKSRIFLTITIMLLCVVTGLPLTIKGDGTLNGQIVLLVYYALGLMTIILGTSTVWISCWAISREVEEKRIQMLVVKPIRRFHIWLGQWLGILFMNAILMSASGIIIYVAIELKLSSSKADPEEVAIVRSEVLTCRMRLKPDMNDSNAEAHELMRVLLEKGSIPADTSHDEAFEVARKRVMASRATVPPGSSKEWSFDLARGVKKESEVVMRYHLSRHSRKRNPVTGSWVVGSDNSASPSTNKIDNYLYGRHTLVLPPKLVQDASRINVTFVNSDRDESNVAVFDMEDDIELLIQTGSFAGNYVRTLLILFCHIALLAAVGLTASSLLTFPVASFTVISLLIVSLLSNYFSATYGNDTGHHHGHGDECSQGASNGIMASMEQVVLKVSIVMAPAMRFQPVGPLTDGILVSRRETAQAVLILLILYPGIFGLAAGWLLNRRELAL